MQEKIKEVDRFLTGLGNKFLSSVRSHTASIEKDVSDFEFTDYEIKEDGVYFKYSYFSGIREDKTDWFMSFDEIKKQKI